jgi:hypothetical protein
MSDLCICSKCGYDKFIATQSVIGSVDVIASVYSDGGTLFENNPTEDGRINLDGLDFSDPQGPFFCAKCDTELEAPLVESA